MGCARESILEGGDVKPTSNGAFLIDIDKRVRYSSRSAPFIGLQALMLFSNMTLTCFQVVIGMS